VTVNIDRRGKTFLSVLGSLAVLVVLLNTVVPVSWPIHMSTYTVGLLGKYMCYAMLAMAVDLIWGYCGILSLVIRRSSPSVGTRSACT
jgi:urea transport system permease protein